MTKFRYDGYSLCGDGFYRKRVSFDRLSGKLKGKVADVRVIVRDKNGKFIREETTGRTEKL